MAEPVALNRSLDAEFLALLRGASLECLVCGEFVRHRPNGVIACGECESEFRTGQGQSTSAGVESAVQAG